MPGKHRKQGPTHTPKGTDPRAFLQGPWCPRLGPDQEAGRGQRLRGSALAVHLQQSRRQSQRLAGVMGQELAPPLADPTQSLGKCLDVIPVALRGLLSKEKHGLRF